MRVLSLDHVVLTVRDMSASAAWYARVLNMEPETFRGADGSLRTALRFGSQKINLHQAGSEWKPHAAHPLPGSADLCFLVGVPLGDVQAHLEACHVTVEWGPVARTGATGPLVSLYVRDLDGNLLELSRPQT